MALKFLIADSVVVSHLYSFMPSTMKLWSNDRERSDPIVNAEESSLQKFSLFLEEEEEGLDILQMHLMCFDRL